MIFHNLSSTLTNITCQLSLYSFFSSRDYSNTLWTLCYGRRKQQGHSSHHLQGAMGTIQSNMLLQVKIKKPVKEMKLPSKGPKHLPLYVNHTTSQHQGLPHTIQMKLISLTLLIWTMVKCMICKCMME